MLHRNINCNSIKQILAFVCIPFLIACFFNADRICLAQTQPVKLEIRLTISVDWEGRDLNEKNLQAIREFRERHPNVRLVHFLNAAYFTKPGVDAEKVRQKMASVIRPGDELGLHIHGWESLFKAAGVQYKNGPTYFGQESAIQLAADRGHAVPISHYSVEELRKVIRYSVDTLEQYGFTEIRSFRAGGWLAPKNVLQALAAEGITIDSSALPTDLRMKNQLNKNLKALIEEAWPNTTVTTQPYEIATPNGAIQEYPNNAGMADYTSPRGVMNMFKINFHEMERSGASGMYFHMGFHQETAANYLWKVEDSLTRIKNFISGENATLHMYTLKENVVEPLPPSTAASKVSYCSYWFSRLTRRFK